MAATVIPILTLALGLQGDFIQGVGVRVRRWRMWQVNRLVIDQPPSKGWRAAQGRAVRAWLAQRIDDIVFTLSVGAAVILGTFGELCAITALWNGNVTRLEAASTRWSLLVLTVLLGVWTVVRFEVTAWAATKKERDEWRAYWRSVKSEAPKHKDSSEPGQGGADS